MDNNPINNKIQNRQNWLDWMKVIGIWLIIYGHFFSICNNYVYVFNVPLFFIISGFLFKREISDKVFWKKTWYNLVIPLLIICTVNYLIGGGINLLSGKLSTTDTPIRFSLKMLCGIHGPLGALWYVYTLIIIRTIFHFINKIHLLLILLFVFLSFAYIINNYDVYIFGIQMYKSPWAISSVFVSYPFFFIGYYLRKWKKRICNYKADHYTPIWILLNIFLIFFCGHNHNCVLLYMCGYGDNIVLFLVGGIAGGAAIYFISKLLETLHYQYMIDISIGTILILGFHQQFISIFKHLFEQRTIYDTIFSVIILLLFVPVIKLCRSHLPILLGKYRNG